LSPRNSRRYQAKFLTLFFTKLLTLVAYPLSAAILLGATALALSFTEWRGLGQLLLGFVLMVLWIAATPVCANWLSWRLGTKVPGLTLEALPRSDAVIVLGGASSDRILRALRIYHAGKAPRILISGGTVPWLRQALPEARGIANILVEFGTPLSALILESNSRTTRENAINTTAIFKDNSWRTALLVTSVTQMPRALAAFRKAGLDVVPAADTFVGPPQVDSLFDLLPDAWTLYWTTSALKEMIGLFIYRVRGWA
jgi:uncharacterized SAM-binding protein YcdF (DUF218 family)